MKFNILPSKPGDYQLAAGLRYGQRWTKQNGP
jgi:hypothetical protein